MCGWWTYAGYLARQGFRVMVFDHRCSGPSTCPGPASATALLDDIDAATRTLVSDGADRVVLVGASQGGAEVVIAGAHPPAKTVGIVALSADELNEPLSGEPYAATAIDAAKGLALPSLFAVATGDRYVSVVDTQALVATVPGGRAKLDVLPPGKGHGWDLLAPGPDGEPAAPNGDILAFLAAQLAPAPVPCRGEPPAQLLRAGPVPVELLGTGGTVVVLSNESDQDRCAWVAFARTLVDKGFRVALWDYGDGAPQTELAGVVSAVRDQGRVVLLGASKGAKASLIAARQLGSAVAGVVSLSAEAELVPDIDVASASAGITVPVLLVTADNDRYGSAEALDGIRRGLADVVVLRVPGAAHGTLLLDDPAVSAQILAFLAAAKGR
jgi:pimeloyl-ACP methyl ester carboxylesterase